MSDEHFYDVDLYWSSDRRGTLTSSDLNTEIEVATPPQFSKGVPRIWSPEHLFIAAISSCLMTTFLAIAEKSKLEFSQFKCKSRGKLKMIKDKYQVTEVILIPIVGIYNENDREKTERILQKSEAACLISNSVKSTIILQPLVVVREIAHS